MQRRWRCGAAGRRSWSRCRASLRARALPDRPRIAIDAEPAFRRLLIERLGERVAIVPRDAADAIVIDARSGDIASQDAPSAAIPALVLVDDPQAEVARTALRNGAAGVLARGAPADEIVAALAAIGAGLLVLDGAAREIVAPAAAPSRNAGAGELTRREREVLAMLAAGHPNRGIAERLAISENTVKVHVAAIFGKLGATTRTEAVTIALRRGLVML